MPVVSVFLQDAKRSVDILRTADPGNALFRVRNTRAPDIFRSFISTVRIAKG